MEIQSKIFELGIIPVAVINDSKDAVLIAEALIKGGLPCIEVTFRTNSAEESIKRISREYPEMLVGAGTVITVEQVKKACLAGAKFIVSPGFDKELCEYCVKNGIVIFPGCATPSEVMSAIKCGVNVIKYFPAKQLGGIELLNAISAPFPNVKFIPTGGIGEDDLVDYLKMDVVFACGGTWMVKNEYIANNDYNKICELASNSMKLVKSIRGVYENI